ncbi:MAG: DegV family protein [Clostridiaceae bacterium]|nr:DegV family protein [Eubacteriales bacterium]
MVKVTADSTCDLTPELLRALDVTLTPLAILVGEQTFHDGVDIVPADIFRYVEKEGKPCSTAAVNVYEYHRLFEELLETYDAVVHINISAEFSSCHQNAALAAKSFENVHVVDSRNLSSGSGHVVCLAAEMAKKGIPAPEIVKALEDVIPRVDASFVIDKLDYLHRGGRCTGLEALGAKLLKLKPSIEVHGGKMTVGKKYMGSFERSLENYVKDKLKDIEDIDLRRVFITHPACPAETVERVRELVRSLASFEEIIETRAGCTISSHCGPDTLGILFIRKTPKAI